MPSFSKLSSDRLMTCDPRIIRVMQEVIKFYDITILCGHRTEEEQEKAFREGASKLHYPHSRHNKYPSLAVDIAPYPIDWKDEARFGKMAGIVLRIAHEMDVPLEWGYDLWGWDMPHFQTRLP